MEKLCTCSFEKSMDDAVATANIYMYKAIDSIDQQFGKGYAKEHPELVAGFMKCCADDNTASMILRFIDNMNDNAQKLAESVYNIRK